MVVNTAANEAHAKRWDEWQLKNEHHEEQRARRARLIFGALFIALVVWAGLMLRGATLFQLS